MSQYHIIKKLYFFLLHIIDYYNSAYTYMISQRLQELRKLLSLILFQGHTVRSESPLAKCHALESRNQIRDVNETVNAVN